MRSLLAAVAVLFCACGPLVDAQLSDVVVCDDVQVIDVAAAPEALSDPPTPQTFARATTWTVPDDVRAALAGQDVSASLVSVTLTAEGVPDLSFVKAAAFDATIDGRAVSMAWDGARDPSGSVTIRPEAPIDMTGLLQASSAEVETSVTAALPATAWRMKVRACFSGAAHVTWGP